MKRTVLALACSFSVIATGCGGKDEGAHAPAAPNTGGAKFTTSDAVDRMFRAQCERSIACAAQWGSMATDVDSCVAGSLFMSEYGWVPLSGYDELFTYDTAAMEACLSDYVASDCRLGGEGVVDCVFGNLVGRLKEGECCPALEGPDACGPGLYCHAGNQGIGLCERLATETQSCANTPCSEKLYCDAVDVVCKPYPTAEQPCGDTGGARYVCDASSYCDATLTCALRKGENDACDANNPCQAHLICRNLKCEWAQGALDATCTAQDECLSGASCVGAPGAKTCVALADIDESCDPSYATAPDCATLKGLECVGGKCANMPRLDEACQAGEYCWPFDDAYCDLTDNRCKPRQADWTACEPPADYVNSPCRRGSECDDTLLVCTPNPAMVMTQVSCPAP